jgi:hypothetical protein
MSPQPAAKPAGHIAQIDDRAAAVPTMTGGETLFGFIDETGLDAERREKNSNYGNHRHHPFRKYVEGVLQELKTKHGMRITRETREMTNLICTEVARLPFLPDDIEKDKDGRTDLDQQIEKTAKRAESQLDSPMVWTAAAKRICTVALDRRKQDPDGTKGIAWIDEHPEERVQRLAEERAAREVV